MTVAVIGDHVPCAEPGAWVVATTASWGGAIGSLEVTLVVVFANLVNHGMDRSLAACRVNVLDKE